jgi:hypothetical protein
VISSDLSQNALCASHIEHAIDLPDYPKTSEGGYAYILNIRGKSEAEINVSLGNVFPIYYQYIMNILLIGSRFNIVENAVTLENQQPQQF